VDAARELAADVISRDRIAGLVSSLVNLKPLTAPFEHLRHERQSLEAAVLVDRCENLVLTSDFDPIPRR